jgi:hypothetical protein
MVRDRRRAPLGHVDEQVFRLKDAQRLAHRAALDAELVGQYGLGRHALAGPQLTGPDPAAQLVGHLAV